MSGYLVVKNPEMARPKPKKNFVRVAEISPYCFQETDRDKLLKVIPLAPSDQRVDRFVEFIEQEIMMLKPERKIEIESPSPQEVKEAITRLKKKSQKLQERSISFQEEIGGLDSESRRLLRKVWQDYDDGTQTFHVSDFLSDLENRISHLLLVINETERITLKKGRPTKDAVHQFSKRLAYKYQAILEIRPTKSRAGAFGKILNICFNAVGLYVEDIFPYIKESVAYCDKLNTNSK